MDSKSPLRLAALCCTLGAGFFAYACGPADAPAPATSDAPVGEDGMPVATSSSGAPVGTEPPGVIPTPVSTDGSTPPPVVNPTVPAPVGVGPVATPEPEGIIIDDGSSEVEMVAGIRPGDKVDLLFVVDNSTSMGDKQELFVSAIPDLIDMLVKPPCLDRGAAGPEDDVLVPFADAAAGTCPAGINPAFAAIKDMHIGVISSSLGAHGLGPDQDPANPVCPDTEHQNDAAHLIALKRTVDAPTLTAESYSGLGFLVWDPEGMHTPTVGEAVQTELVRKFQAQVAAVDETGCGFEAPLEAAYRFLVDPEPYATLARVPCSATSTTMACVEPQGTDDALLAQRQAFLRPNSHVVVTYLTDENDCSIRDSQQGYYAMRPRISLARGTAICATDPNNECCHSCQVSTPPAACSADPAVNGCVEPLAEAAEANEAFLAEAFNVRCYDQERRFGINFLYSPTRYLAGFKNLMVENRAKTMVPNPLFAGGRPLSQVFVVGIVGTPWQDISTPTGEVKRAVELPWDWFLPSATGAAPADPFNVESTAIRAGVNPVTMEAIGGPGTANAINGHDRTIMSGDGLVDDLQYACTFPLTTPRDCTAAGTNDTNCDCTRNPNIVNPDVIDDYATNNPLCLAPDGTYGTTQYRAKAYPSPRVMEVVRGMENQGVLGSICPRNVTDPSMQDYGYRPPIRALLLGLSRPAAR